jgi:hypothetical protein
MNVRFTGARQAATGRTATVDDQAECGHNQPYSDAGHDGLVVAIESSAGMWS